ncbi:hypothetical protein HDE_02197 [Halotydeus destructor]|nr:hypothetical protein HDE_02197 [Halotydeus destructor]
MRKLTKSRAVPCPIPRPPPCPPRSENVQNLKRMLLNSNKHALVSDSPVESRLPDPVGTLDHVNVDELPPPPDEFLEDIRAVRKTEEIEGPFEDPFDPLSGPPSSESDHGSEVQDTSVLHLAAHFEQVVNLSTYHGHGSLNSSFTESASERSSSGHESWSPLPSPLPSPSVTSLDSVSTANCTMGVPEPMAAFGGHRNSISCIGTRFPFPPACVPHAAYVPLAANGSPLGVTLAPFTGSHGRLSAINSLTSIGGGTLPRAASGQMVKRPPDYQTAMHRLCLMKQKNCPTSPTMAAPRPAVNHVTSDRVTCAARGPVPAVVKLTPLVESRDMPDGAQPTIKSALSRDRARRASGTPGHGQAVRKAKRRVHFSDQVTLVAHSADIDEDHLPNPLLDRVLGKRYMAAAGIQNGAGGSSSTKTDNPRTTPVPALIAPQTYL